MKLFLTASSERGKPVTKSGNEYIKCEIIDEQQNELITLHITACHSQINGKHYNVYMNNPQGQYLAVTER